MENFKNLILLFKHKPNFACRKWINKRNIYIYFQKKKRNMEEDKKANVEYLFMLCLFFPKVAFNSPFTLIISKKALINLNPYSSRLHISPDY